MKAPSGVYKINNNNSIVNDENFIQNHDKRKVKFLLKKRMTLHIRRLYLMNQLKTLLNMMIIESL